MAASHAIPSARDSLARAKHSAAILTLPPQAAVTLSNAARARSFPR
jgi:hypothetical protein